MSTRVTLTFTVNKWPPNVPNMVSSSHEVVIMQSPSDKKWSQAKVVSKFIKNVEAKRKKYCLKI